MKKKIIVIGGGFAGIQFIKKIDDTLFDVLLIDKINHHQFQPLFYQVATSQLEPASISFPLRNIFKSKKNLQIRLAEVLSIDSVNNKIETTIGEFFYDYLVIAIGCTTNFFGNDEIRSHAFTLKTTYDAINIRNHILQTFEDIISAETSDREGLLNLTIVGAGPTGVELAGAFAEIKNNILPKDYPDIDFTHFKINLIEGSKDTLNSMSISAKRTSKKYLQKMGVNIITETFVKRYDGNLLELSNGNIIKSKTVIWAAGVIGNTIKGLPDSVQKVGNRIDVNRTNLVNGTQNIFALGDIAFMAYNLNKTKTNEFEYNDLGSMATIGRNKAVVDLPHFKFKGYFAWLIWMFLHLMLILSVRNKLIIFINWVWAYLTKDTSLRLILKQTKNY